MAFFGNTTSTTERPEPAPRHDYKFLIVPLVVIFIIMLLSALVYLMARRKRRRDILRQNLMAMYEFDSNEQEWESLNSYESPSYTYGSYSNTAV